MSYASIGDVPDGALEAALLRALGAYGATAAEELTQAVARQLGFKRTGRRIQERIVGAINQLICTGKICRTEDERLQLTRNAGVAWRQ